MQICTAELYQIVGAFDAYGACRYVKHYRETDGTLSKNYPGHSEIFIGTSHKRWRWWVNERRLDGPELMHWTPDAEERDKIDRVVASCLNFNPDIPRFAIDEPYPNPRQVYNPTR